MRKSARTTIMQRESHSNNINNTSNISNNSRNRSNSMRKHTQQNKKTSRISLSYAISLLFALIVTVIIMILCFHIYWKNHALDTLGAITIASNIKLRGTVDNNSIKIVRLNNTISNSTNPLELMRGEKYIIELKKKSYNVSFMINIDGSQV